MTDRASELYTLDEDVARELADARPVLLHALTGFVDAGGAGRVAVEHLLERFRPTRLVTFEVDELVDYRSRRPMMTFDASVWSDYEAPSLVLDLLRDTEGTAFLLLHGSEPDIRWERFVAAVVGLVERFDVALTIGMNGVPMGVPHTRPIGSTVHGTVPEAGEGHAWFGTVAVPAAVDALLEFRLSEQGHEAMGVAVHVPHYLAASSYPEAAIVALRQVERVSGLDLGVDALAEPAATAQAEVQRQVGEDTDVAAVVSALEQQYDTITARLGPVLAPGDLPTADELGEQFERFLAQQIPPDQG